MAREGNWILVGDELMIIYNIHSQSEIKLLRFHWLLFFSCDSDDMITVGTTTQIEIETYHSGLIKDEIPLDPSMPIRVLLPPRCPCPRCCCYVRLVVLWVLICAVVVSPNLTPGHYRLQLSNGYSQRMSSRYKPSLPNFLLPSRLLRQESLERRKNNPIHFHSTLLWRKLRLFTMPRRMMRCAIRDSYWLCECVRTAINQEHVIP